VIDGCLFFLLSAADAAVMVVDRTREEAADGTFVFEVVYVRHDAEMRILLSDGSRAADIAGCSADHVQTVYYSAQ
jgi:hypothetical protein